MARTVIALLTDFGTRDPYVGVMKAVMASRTAAAIIDLSHDVAPFDVFEAAFYLRNIVDHLTAQRFIVVAVVDPEVGTDRRILAMERTGQTFLAPDNGLLSLIASEDATLYSVENEGLFLAHGSSTFHGRDRFAPVAAAIANGMALDRLGPRISISGMKRLDYSPPQTVDGITRGRVMSIDRYGNVITDIPAGNVPQSATLHLRGRKIEAFAATYAEGQRISGPFAIIGSRGTYEISVTGGSAADLLQIARFDPVEIRPAKP